MRFGDVVIPAGDAAGLIRKYQKISTERKQAKDFKTWANLYATPFARDLYKDPYAAARIEALVKKPDAGIKTVAEVAKVSDKLVETKQQQAQVKEELQKKSAEGDQTAVSQLVKADKALEKKAQLIEDQLATRVTEGVDLVKAKAVAEKNRNEVLQKRVGQAAAAPHLADAWRKHDALYEMNRLRVVNKHSEAEKKADELKAEIAQLPKSIEKDAKMERLRKEEAQRRISQELELAKFDASEAGRVDARAKIAGMKQVN